MSTSKLTVANRALQKVGLAKRLGTFEDNSQAGRAIRDCYDTLKKAELQGNVWTFAVRRLQISAETETPAFDHLYQFQLPSDFLKMAPRLPMTAKLPDDYVVEGRKVLSSDAGPLNLRIVSSDAKESEFHALFVEGLAARIGFEVCEELTQSSAKKDTLATEYIKFISDAKLQNAIEKGPVRPNVDNWESVRQGGGRNVPWSYGR